MTSIKFLEVSALGYPCSGRYCNKGIKSSTLIYESHRPHWNKYIKILKYIMLKSTNLQRFHHSSEADVVPKFLWWTCMAFS